MVEYRTLSQRVPGHRLQTTEAGRHEHWGIILEMSRSRPEPGDRRGPPEGQRGTPEDKRGPPGDKSGTPGDKRGTPEDQRGTPEDQRGTLGGQLQTTKSVRNDQWGSIGARVSTSTRWALGTSGRRAGC